MSDPGWKFSATVDLRELENGLRRIQLAGRDLRPVWRATRKALRVDQREHAKKRLASTGTWPTLAASTILHRRQRRGKQGRKRKRPVRANVKPLGRLPAAFTIKYDARSIRGVSRVPWSGAHNDPNGATVGHHSRIPGREFLWPSRQLLDIIAREAMAYLHKAWDGKRR